MSDLTTKPLLKNDAAVQTSPLAPTSTEATVLTVEQLNSRIKQVMEGQIGTVWVQGEISNFKAHTSGHFYFSVKDAKSQISAVMFRGHNSRLRFKPTDGLEVVIRGRVTVYEPRGNYQIMCEAMEPVGAGALQKAFEQLRDKLKAEGLFAAERKRPIPHFPRHVAVVTSPTGAAIRDVLNVMGRRAKSVRVTVVPTVVQGADAAPQIVQALKAACRLPDVDVVIIGRGGGSMEDLWAFNDETLARTIVASPIPVISAVGHEIDFTISDFVADLRAPTPSAAAELVAKSSAELVTRIQNMNRLLGVALDRKLKTIGHQLAGLQKRLVDPRKRLQDLMLRNDDLLTRMELAMRNLLQKRCYKVELATQKLGQPARLIERQRQLMNLATLKLRKAAEAVVEKQKSRSQRLMALLDSLSPLKVVERGYSIVTKGNAVVKSAAQVQPGDEIDIRLAEGGLTATVVAVKGK